MNRNAVRDTNFHMIRPDRTIDPAWWLVSALTCTTLCVALAGCQRHVAIRVDHSVPAAVVEALPMTVGVHYDQSLSSHVFEDNTDERGQWRIDSGTSQLKMFRSVFGDLFSEVREQELNAGDDLALHLAPEVVEMQFATPEETGFEYFESWIKYRIAIYDGRGAELSPWQFSGYGQALKRGGLEAGLSAALEAALRNAGARLITEFPEHPPIRDYLGANR